MSKIIVVNNPKKWPLEMEGVEVVAAKDYLMNPRFAKRQNLKVFNLCRSYRYQTTGYYVSLLAAARGHRAFPGVTTIQEMKSPSVVRIVTEDIEDLVQKSLSSIQSSKFVLSIYFGKNLAKKYDQLSFELFRLFQAPLLRAFFSRRKGKWKMTSIQLISSNEIPDEHFLYVILFAEEYFAKKIYRVHQRKILPYDLAILIDESAEEPPTNKKGIQKFMKAAEQVGFTPDIIDKDDYHRIAEYDALFIRETTAVNHYTFRFAQRARAEGLVVIDDPESILRCANKVYLAEMCNNYHIGAPKTVILARDSIAAAPEQLGFPMILKQPDSAFSLGVVKVETIEEYQREALRLLDGSDLILAQEFLPTEFDWRIGVLDREPLFACKYFMAKSHWQVMDWSKNGEERYGSSETLPMESVPPQVLKMALRASNLIGDGLYGVDIKEAAGRFYLIEVNDNPNLEAGAEDLVGGDEIYLKVMNYFLKHVQLKKEGNREHDEKKTIPPL